MLSSQNGFDGTTGLDSLPVYFFAYVVDGDFPLEISWSIASEMDIDGLTVSTASGTGLSVHRHCPSMCGPDENELFVLAEEGWASDVSIHVTDCFLDAILDEVVAEGSRNDQLFCIPKSSLSNGVIVTLSDTFKKSWVLYDDGHTLLKANELSELSTCGGDEPVDPRFGNGMCDDEINVSPLWDGGDCCRFSCKGLR